METVTFIIWLRLLEPVSGVEDVAAGQRVLHLQLGVDLPVFAAAPDQNGAIPEKITLFSKT
jgi:hypothetical protein